MPLELFELLEAVFGKKVDILGVVGLLRSVSWSLSVAIRGFLADSFETSDTFEWDEEQVDEVAEEQDSTLAMVAILVAGPSANGGGVLVIGDSKPIGCFGKGGVDGGVTAFVVFVVDCSTGRRYAKLLRSMGIVALVGWLVLGGSGGGTTASASAGDSAFGLVTAVLRAESTCMLGEDSGNADVVAVGAVGSVGCRGGS